MEKRNHETKKECLAKEVAKKVPNAKRRLNTEFLEKMTPALLSDIDTNDEVRTWLKTLGETL